MGLSFWQKYGSDPANVNAKDPLVATAKDFGFGSTTDGDVSGEASGRIADRKWKASYWKAMKGYYCKIDRRNKSGQRDFLHVFAHEFCLEGFNYRAGDAVNFVIGQGDAMVTPLQLARAYARSPTGAPDSSPGRRGVVSPTGKLLSRDQAAGDRQVPTPRRALQLHQQRAERRRHREGTLACAFAGFPLSKVQIAARPAPPRSRAGRATSGSRRCAERPPVRGRGDGAQVGRPARGRVGPVRHGKIWEHLYGITGWT